MQGDRRIAPAKTLNRGVLYWPMVILSFLFVGSAWPQFVAASLPDKFTAIFLIGMDWRLAFASYPTPYWGGSISGLN